MSPVEKRKPRILFLNDHLGWKNQIHGVARLFSLWVTHLDPGKYEAKVCILREKSNLSKPFEEKGIPVIFLGKSRFDPTTTLSLLKIIKKEKIDIMHIQGYGSTIFGRLAGMIARVPIVVHFHDTRKYYPFIQHVSDRTLGRFAQAYLAVSNSARDWWAYRYKLPAEKITVMYNCASFEEFRALDADQITAAKQTLGIAPDHKVVGTVTRLFEEKGTRYLLEAAPEVLKAFPQTMFVIVGDGPLRNELKQLSLNLGLQNNVVFVGYVEKVAPILGTFDIKVLTSYHSEGGSPLPVIEAMAMGKPVIVTSMVETVEDGVNGLVIPSRDVRLLAEKIIYLLSNKDEAERLGVRGKETSQVHDVKNYVRNLEQLYDSLLSKIRKAA